MIKLKVLDIIVAYKFLGRYFDGKWNKKIIFLFKG